MHSMPRQILWESTSPTTTFYETQRLTELLTPSSTMSFTEATQTYPSHVRTPSQSVIHRLIRPVLASLSSEPTYTADSLDSIHQHTDLLYQIVPCQHHVLESQLIQLS